MSVGGPPDAADEQAGPDEQARSERRTERQAGPREQAASQERAERQAGPDERAGSEQRAERQAGRDERAGSEQRAERQAGRDEQAGSEQRAEMQAGPEEFEQIPTEPTPEQYAERARRADKATRGALAGVLALEALVVLLIPRTIAFTSGLGPVRTGICIGIAVVLVLATGLLRRPWGIGLGSALQVVFTATGIMITTMFVVGVLFLLIWLRVLMLRHEVVGSPGGLRMLAG